MRHFFHLFLHDHRWFIGTVAVIGILFFFFWGLFGPESLQIAWNRFALLLGQSLKGAIMILIIFCGFKIMLKGSFGSKGSEKKH